MNIFYDQRAVISEPREEPICWECSKVDDVGAKGIIRLTWAQTTWNEHTDYIEKDSEGNVIGMWCNYFDDNGKPPEKEAVPQTYIYSTITYSGRNEIKVGGSFKKLTVNFFENDKPIDYKLGNWAFEINGEDASSLLTTSTEGLEPNQIKVKFIGSEKYMGKTLVASYTSTTGIMSKVGLSITGV
jgi:hypothetical protein